jgi:predicted membrane protein
MNAPLNTPGQEPRRRDDSSLWSGLFIILIGAALFVNMFVDEPDWLFSWPMLVIGLGIFFGFKNGFAGPGWLITLGVGCFFLIDNYFIEVEIGRFFWPVAVIVVGIMMITKPNRRRNRENRWNQFDTTTTTATVDSTEPTPTETQPHPQTHTQTQTQTHTHTQTQTPTPSSEPIKSPTYSLSEEVLDVTAVFGSVKRIIYSKNFRGGEIVSVFGGADVNLLQADLAAPEVVIESVQIFGGAKLVIPADWVVVNEAVAIFGGIEDKRPPRHHSTGPEKVIILKGFAMFGGIEIKSF